MHLAKNYPISLYTAGKEFLRENLEQSVIILCAPAIFQVATLYSLVAWENVWKSLTTATTGNVSQEAPATAPAYLANKGPGYYTIKDVLHLS